MANIKDIAAKVGISNTAVSKYLRDPNTKHVSAELKAKIDQAVKELNYRRNVIARSLSSKKSNIISILIPYSPPFSRSSFLNELLSGLESVLLKNGYHMIFLANQGEDSPAIVKQQLEQGYGFDGFVLFNTRYCTLENIEKNAEELTKTRCPFVVVNSPVLHADINQVVFATPESSNAVNFLLNQGHERIALMLGRDSSAMCRQALVDYGKQYETHGMTVDNDLILFGDYEREVARGAMLSFLHKSVDFSAVYCVSDTMALGVYEALKEHNLRIPEDVSVVGKHDAFFSNFLYPPLTTVRVKIFECGVRAAEILLETIQHDRPSKKIFLDNELILRSSTKVWR